MSTSAIKENSSHPHPSTLAYKNDYTIDAETLETSVDVASIPSLLLMSIINVGFTALIIALILINYELDFSMYILLVSSLSVTIILYITSGIGGLIWQKMGLWVASNTYKIYTNKYETPFLKHIGALYLRFAGKNAVIYLEGQALDVNYNNIMFRLKFVFSIAISQLSFFLLYLTYVWNPIFASNQFLTSIIFPEYNREFQIILSLACSIGTLALYLPATFILRDANLRVWKNDKRVIGQPLDGLRSTIQSLIGISAILTGWEVYKDLAGDGNLLLLDYISPEFKYISFGFLLDYFVSLIVLIILAGPMIFPAAVMYNFKHSDNVNKFRTAAILSGVEVGISKIRKPTRQEKDTIGTYINNHLT